MHNKTKTYDKSEQRHEVGTLVPTSAHELGTRIGLIADLVGTRARAAAAAGVSVASLQRYISGEVEPPFNAIARLAGAADARIEWLATGEGPMRTMLGVGEETPPAFSRRPGITGQEATALLLRVFREEGYEPTGMWGAMFVSLLVSGDITETGVRQALRQLKGAG